MEVRAREITAEDQPSPRGPFLVADLALASNFGLFERYVSRGSKLMLLARVEGRLVQVRDKDNQDHRLELGRLRSRLPRPQEPCRTRWTARMDENGPYTRRHEKLVHQAMGARCLELCRNWPRDPQPWILHLEQAGIERALSSWSDLDFAIKIPDPAEPRSHSVYLTKPQLDKILILGMP